MLNKKLFYLEDFDGEVLGLFQKPLEMNDKTLLTRLAESSIKWHEALESQQKEPYLTMEEYLESHNIVKLKHIPRLNHEQAREEIGI